MPWKDPAKNAEYRARNRDKRAAQARERYANNPQSRQARLDGNRRSNFRWKYGITLEQRDQMLADQDGKCAICRTDSPPTVSGWHVDHCHAANEVRGILCQHCNNMLGMAKDNIAILERAIAYLGGKK